MGDGSAVIAEIDLIGQRSGRPAGKRGAAGVVARPRLLERLDGAARVTLVAALAGSGKTVLLRSWTNEGHRAGRVAWAGAEHDGDARRFWTSVGDALRATEAGAALVRDLSVVPGADGWGLVEGLLADLAALKGPLWLVVDDVHELGEEVLSQLELLTMRAPAGLRFVLASRHDVRLGLHRLRLEGELAEVRGQDLRFSLEEARALFAAAGVDLPATTVAVLHERTEGWAAGLRLAALALSGHPDPAGFAAEFSGSERTVAEYLVAEVLDRQPEHVRRMLVRTSILERVNGELADLLTGDQGGERVLHDLAAANAFTGALDPSRTWFRYHQQFAEMLRLELRYDAPAEVAGLHRAASGWFARHGYPVEAVRHAQAAGDWELAADLLTDHGLALGLDGRAPALRELLAGFPAGYVEANAALAVAAASGEVLGGSGAALERYLALAGKRMDSLPEERRGQVRLWHAAICVVRAYFRGDLAGVIEEHQRFTALAESMRAVRPGLVADLSALSAIALGSAEVWAIRPEALGHLEEGIALARRTKWPILEFFGVAMKSALDTRESFERAAEGARAAIEMARRHGWTSEPAFRVACTVLGSVRFWQGQLEEAEHWIQQSERTLRAETRSAEAMTVRALRGLLELARGRDAEALLVFEAAGSLEAGRRGSLRRVAPATSALLVHALVRAGETERAERLLAELGPDGRDDAEVRISAAALRLAQDDPRAAVAELVPVADRPGPVHWKVLACVLEAAAWDMAGEQTAAGGAAERALDLAEPDGAVMPFLLYPLQGLLDRHAGRPTAHAALLAGIQDLLVGGESPGVPAPARERPLVEAPSESELRVLRYLPTHLSAPEIARELHVSPNTIRTHIRSLYLKLGTHSRAETVARARALGLLARSAPDRAPAAPVV